MIEIKNLNKIYRTKGAPDTHALVDVSIKLESTGMVFILGKSGSGKSTFLNVVGGLDSSDGGEIIIRGKSSKDFGGSDFDSYRNTYLGFVFQEYNLIDEFSIGRNIGLALELQHKKATKEVIESILNKVDMQGYADRMPTKISGGQKQRVAIARALIKEPQIIMADEPTGALDSVTGEQIFQTLKNLSKDKLVMVVSHDREYAEEYGDRIVEFKDGRIISDMIRSENGLQEQIKQVDGAMVVDNLIKIPAGTALTDNHTKLIQELLNTSGELIISSDKALNKQFDDSFTQQSKAEKKGKFVATQDQMLTLDSDKTPFRLIKSKLPAANAAKMARSSMKHKRGRLIFSIILAVFAITFFGFSSVVGGFKEGNAVRSVMNAYSYNHIRLEKMIVSSKDGMYGYGPPTKFSDKDKAKISDISSDGIAKYVGFDSKVNIPAVSSQLDSKYNHDYFGTTIISGAVCTDNLDKIGLDVPEVYGRMPQRQDEILISNYIAEIFSAYGMRYVMDGQDKELSAADIKNINDILNYTVKFYINSKDVVLKIVGIVNFDIERYSGLKEMGSEQPDKVLMQEFNDRRSFDISYIYGLESLSSLVESWGMDNMYHYSTAINLPEVDLAALKKKHGSYQLNLKTTTLPQLINTQNYQITYLGADGSTTLPQLNKGEVIINISDYMIAKEILATQMWVEEPATFAYDLSYLEQISSQLGIFDPDFRLNTSVFLSRIYYDHNQIYPVYNTEGLKVVGVISAPTYDNNLVIISEHDYNEFKKEIAPESLFVYLKDYQTISKLTNNYIGRQKSEDKNIEYIFSYMIPTSDTISQTAQLFSIMSKVFFWLSIAFCVFAALLMLNFISTSVTYKRKEIGVLRAIGARKMDVVFIFAIEGLFIAMWILAFSIFFVFASVVAFNNILSIKLVIPFTLLSLGVLDIIFMSLVCFVTVLVASIIPVSKVASLKPMDAIRGK